MTELVFDVDRSLLRQLGIYDVPVPAGADLAGAMPVHPGVINHRGGLQGGLIATLVDIVAGRAVVSRLAEGMTAPTADLHIRYLAPITAGPAVAVARILREGRSQVVVEIEVTDAGRNILAAHATAMFSILTARPGQEDPQVPRAVGSEGRRRTDRRSAD
jgi:uncharacterized protein (TIGR00369 family)